MFFFQGPKPRLVELAVKIQSCVLLGCTGSVTKVEMATKAFNAPIAAACRNLLFKVHVVEIRVVNFVCFFHDVFLKDPLLGIDCIISQLKSYRQQLC
jgi:hypothetical protein